jgi:two-component system chemotaxis sensor kinase CheA
MVGEMVISQSLVRHDPDLSAGLKPRLARNLSQLARITDDIQRTAMSMRMIPVGQLFQKTSRLVRDLSRKAGKQVELELAGEETELDRNIVEELADPLMHMVRNSVDHGIELPADRVAAGKPAQAHVTLKAGHQAGHIVIQISDDGRGLAREKILRKAREKNLIEAGVEPSESEIFALIFHPGFSTADKITDVSGRGVGMDVVRKQVQKLRGRIDVISKPGEGTTFLLKLPLTLAIIDGLVVGVGDQRYIVPIFAVREMLRPAEEAISTIHGRQEMAMVRGSLIPVIRLHQRFHVKPKNQHPWESLLIVTESGSKLFGLMVDELIGKQEVVIKSLGEGMRNIAGVAGGAILGDGRVGLILDPEGLFGSSNGASHGE